MVARSHRRTSGVDLSESGQSDSGWRDSGTGLGPDTTVEAIMTTHRYALPFPVAPGKTDADVRSIAGYFKSHMDQYRESRRRLGLTVERAYIQKTPMGSYLVSYVETDHTFAEWTKLITTSPLDIDKKFIQMVADIHGVDLRKPLAGSPPETIGEWVDPDVKSRKKGQAFVAPVLPGKDEAGRAFAHEAYVTRRTELTESRRAIGGNVEVVTLNVTPMGSFICGYVEGNNPVEDNKLYLASKRPYDLWFRDQTKRIFPPEVDFSKPLPAVELVFDYVAELARV